MKNKKKESALKTNNTLHVAITDSTFNSKDIQGFKKHNEMLARAAKGLVHPNCKWAQNSKHIKAFPNMSVSFEAVGLLCKGKQRKKEIHKEISTLKNKCKKIQKADTAESKIVLASTEKAIKALQVRIKSEDRDKHVYRKLSSSFSS
jgi:hypothetical protein